MNLFTQFFKSMYSPNDIAAFRFQGIGKTILYVFMLTLISVIPSTFYTAGAINEAIRSAQETIENDLPVFTVENGILHSDRKEPLTIKNGSFTIIFDSTGAVEEEDMAGMESTFAMLQNEAVLTAGGETNSIPYSVINEGTFTKQDTISLFNSVSSSLPIFIGLIFIAIYIFSSGMKFIEISFLALFGLLLKNLAGKKLQYQHLWRMAAYSITLPTIFFTIMALLKTDVPYGFMINWFVSSMILLLAIKEIPAFKKDID